MQDVNILADAEWWVRELFNKHPDPNLLYHNLQHTESVVQRAIEIGNYYQLSKEELTVLSMAAWFHDTGQLFGANAGHELRSVEQFNLFIKRRDVSENFTQKVTGCILATKIPHHPTNFLEEVICDADTYDLGTSAFFENDINLQNEVRLRTGISDKDWDRKTLALFQTHIFYTQYCKERLTAGKKAIIQRYLTKNKNYQQG